MGVMLLPVPAFGRDGGQLHFPSGSLEENLLNATVPQGSRKQRRPGERMKVWQLSCRAFVAFGVEAFTAEAKRRAVLTSTSSASSFRSSRFPSW